MSDKIITRCKGCVFAIHDQELADIDVFDLSTKLSNPEGEKVQCGCSLGRDEKLKVAQRDEDGDFVLERFCTAFRPDEWVESLSFEDQLNTEQLVMEELYPRMGYFVKFDEDLTKLDLTLESIVRAAHQTQGQPPFMVVINSKVEYNEEIWSLLVTRFGEAGETNYHILQLNDELKSVDHVIDEAFIHAENGWVYITSAGEVVPEHTVDKLHKMLSVDMKQIVAVEPYNNHDGFIFPCFLFKFLNGNNVKIFRDEFYDGRKFIDKLKERQGEVKTIYTWEEFNAS